VCWQLGSESNVEVVRDSSLTTGALEVGFEALVRRWYRMRRVVEVIVRAMRQWFEVSRQWRREEEIEREGERVMCYKGNDVCM
jgi:hypothetical protein